MSYIRYACEADVLWSVETRGVRLMNMATGGSQIVTYPEAAVWDLITRNSPLLVEKVTAITGLNSGEAALLISKSVEQWTRDGFLVSQGE